MEVAHSQSHEIKAVQAFTYQKVACSNYNTTAPRSAPLTAEQMAQHRVSLSKGYSMCMLISVQIHMDIAPACLSIIQTKYAQFPFLIPLVVSPLPAAFCPHGQVTDLSNLLMI